MPYLLRNLQLSLGRVLPEFAAQKKPDEWTLLRALWKLKEPPLILLDQYERASETKELVEWIETRLLAEAEECEQVRFIICGQIVPDSTRARWRDRAEAVELERISEQHAWNAWVDERNLNVAQKSVEGIVLGLQGLPGPITVALSRVLRLEEDLTPVVLQGFT